MRPFPGRFAPPAPEIWAVCRSRAFDCAAEGRIHEPASPGTGAAV